MKHRLWPYTQRLIDKMADSSLQDAGISIRREPRSGGLHASTLLQELHPYEGKGDDPVTPEQLKVYGMLGCAFEDRVETALLSLAAESDWPFNAMRPGEVECEGVSCSPDILLLPKDSDDWVELSIKMTWKSCRDLPMKPGQGGFPSRFDYYLDQCMVYGKAMNKLESVLLVCFMNGNYKGNKHPQIHGWQLEYSERERSETWQALMNIRKQRKL